jgi:hypothetical protein
MLRLKKRYANQTIALSDGTLINASNIERPRNQKLLKSSPAWAYMLEEGEPKADAPKADAPKADAPKAPTAKRTRTKKSS